MRRGVPCAQRMPTSPCPNPRLAATTCFTSREPCYAIPPPIARASPTLRNLPSAYRLSRSCSRTAPRMSCTYAAQTGVRSPLAAPQIQRGCASIWMSFPITGLSLALDCAIVLHMASCESSASSSPGVNRCSRRRARALVGREFVCPYRLSVQAPEEATAYRGI